RRMTLPELFNNIIPESEIIRYHGYPSEEYQVTTEDGYILGVFRIPAGRNSQNTGKKPAVLLHHGTLGDSIHWISNLPNNSLGFILADAGYDVWLGNSRGDTWSLKHKTLKPCQKEFWQFSFDEIGKYDIPAELYFIMNKTGQKDVYYVGHSEASTAGFIAFSTYPELAQRVKVFFALGPAATITYATSPLVTLTRLPQSLIRQYVAQVLHSFILSQHWIAAFITLLLSLQSRTDMYVGHFPAGTSVQNAIHWHQGSLHAVDLGKCLLLFLQSTPPAYKIEKIGTPIAVWSGGQDKFADPKDMAKLLPRIPNLIYHEHFPAWGHLSFIWGLDATEKMYRKIIELMTKHP
uniref:Partial AB-hydrolase lipase domain-containing protein n=1 Tax=Strix occidentalis caurina TaxID=311401 RepID=A0A8D0EKE8_STROC